MSLDTLSLYGKSFQLKVVTCLMTKSTFVAQIYDILDPTFFEIDAVSELVKIIKYRFNESKNVTTLDIFKVEISKIKNELLKDSMIENLKEIVGHTNDIDLDYIQSEFLTFCKNQSMKRAILNSVDLISNGRYDDIHTSIKKALNVGIDRNLGLEYDNIDLVETRLSDNQKFGVIETEWPVLNEILDGGMSAGDLGILIGNAGSGKSWILTSLGLHALKMGKNVLHVTLELSEEYTSKRYDSKLTGINSANLKYHVDDVVLAIKNNIKGKLNIKFYPTKSITVNTLRSIVERAIMIDRKPDLIIVDYGDLLKSDSTLASSGGSYQESGTIYEELRGLAGEFNVPVWTASQSNRSSSDKDIITGQDISESYKKIMIADFVVSISRKIADKLQDTVRWHVIKNRYGPDGLTFPGKMDTSIGNIEIYTPTSIQGNETKKTMQSGNELIRKELSKKYKELNGFEESE